MATYTVPPDMKEKEKIVGGILTISQFIWLMVGLLIIGAVMFLLYYLNGAFSMVIGAPLGLAVGLPFAFYKKEELTLFQYLSLKSKFKKKRKELPNIKGKGVK
jgi:hypothetical protein